MMQSFVLGLLVATSAYAQSQGPVHATPPSGQNVYGTAARPKVHEIHTTSEREVIRVEEYKRPRQVIRIHEAPAPPPEIIRVQAPPEPQKVIRVVQRARPTRVQFTQTEPEVQVVNIPIRQVQRVIRPVVVQEQVDLPRPVVTQSLIQPVLQAAPVIQRSIHVPASPIAQSVPSRVQTFSARPVSTVSYGAAPAAQVSYINAQPVQVQYSAPVNYAYSAAPRIVQAPTSYISNPTYNTRARKAS